MIRFRNLLSVLLLVSTAVPCHAALIRTFDLTTLCWTSTDVVEATLVRHHIAGQEDWRDTFAATVTNPLEGSRQLGDKIQSLHLELYSPAKTGQHCILFLAPAGLSPGRPAASPAPLQVVDMLVIDRHDRVRRYFQQSNPGGLVADGFIRTIHPPTNIKTTHSHGALVYAYQENSTFEENDTSRQRFRSLAEERVLITTKWAAAKKLKTPPYQVLKPTER